MQADEMPHFAAFHLGLHFLPKYTFRGLQNTKGYYKHIDNKFIECLYFTDNCLF